MYVDTHTHVISADKERYPYGPLLGKQSVWSQERPVPAEGLLEAMDDAQVDKAVVVQATTVYGYDNRYSEDSVAAHPDRFVGVCTVDFRSENAVADLQRWIGDGHFSGVRIFTSGTTIDLQENWLDDPSTYPAWEYVQSEHVPVCVQTATGGIPHLRNVLKKFPGTVVLLDHMARPTLDPGAPYPEAAPIFELSEEESVFFKISSSLIRRAEQVEGGAREFLRFTADRFGADRMAWGSSYPASKGTLTELLHADQDFAQELSEDEKQWLFSDTAKRIYPALVAQGRASA